MATPIVERLFPNRPMPLPPRLQNGDHLTLAEFKTLYTNSPDIRRAELIEGIVYVASPVHLPHSQAQGAIIGLLYAYKARTPTVFLAGEQSVQIDGENEVQPDALLWKADCVEIVDGLLIGAPTLVVEVAVSTRSYDLGLKKRIYRRNGVQEYLVLAAHEKQIFWFKWVDGAYVEIEPDEDDIYRSEEFAGLWLDAAAFWAQDDERVMATLNQGIALREK